jgi:hypothetical protein
MPLAGDYNALIQPSRIFFGFIQEVATAVTEAQPIHDFAPIGDFPRGGSVFYRKQQPASPKQPQCVSH